MLGGLRPHAYVHNPMEWVDPLGGAGASHEDTQVLANHRAGNTQVMHNGARWKAQAKGRYVDEMVKKELSTSHPHLKLNAVGVDTEDPTTGLSYDTLLGSKKNIHTHAMRMPDVLFSYIEF